MGGNISLIKEFWDFLKHSKRWWLLPIIIVLVLMSLLILVAAPMANFPFIYAIF